MKSGRKLLKDRFQLTKIEVIGQFDHQTDVDVFIAAAWSGRKARMRSGMIGLFLKMPRTDEFRIILMFALALSYRTEIQSGVHPTLSSMPAIWPVGKPYQLSRSIVGLKGRTFAPPFVVIRRTSRPGDKHRAIPTLITGQRPVAVKTIC